MPSYTDIPEAEYKNRIRAAQQVMKERGLDGLFVTEFENIYYLSGIQSNVLLGTRDWPYAFILNADGRVAFVVRGGTEEVAYETTWVDKSDIRGYRMIPDAGEAIKKALDDIGLKGKKVGAELGEVTAVKFNTGLFLDLVNTAGVEFVDGAKAIWDLRMVKSDLEVDRIRQAARIASRAAPRAFEKLKVGMTERDVSRLVSQYMIEEGADQPAWTTIVQSGDKFTKGLGGTFPATRKIRKGEWVQIDFGAVYRHYNSDMNRIALVRRKPTKAEQDHWNLYAEANKKGTAAVRPGVTAADIFGAMDKVFTEGGVKYIGVRAGHGLGLDPHEPPHLGYHDKTVVKKGMVFAIEPFAAPNKDGIRFNCEDDVACTATGSQRLSTMSREIFLA